MLALWLPIQRRLGVHVYGMACVLLLTALAFAVFFSCAGTGVDTGVVPNARTRANVTDASGSSSADLVTLSMAPSMAPSMASSMASSTHRDRAALLLPILSAALAVGIGVGMYARPSFAGRLTLFDRFVIRNVGTVLGLCVLSVAHGAFQLPPSTDAWFGGGILLWWAQYVLRLLWGVRDRRNAISRVYGAPVAVNPRPMANVKAPHFGIPSAAPGVFPRLVGEGGGRGHLFQLL